MLAGAGLQRGAAPGIRLRHLLAALHLRRESRVCCRSAAYLLIQTHPDHTPADASGHMPAGSPVVPISCTPCPLTAKVHDWLARVCSIPHIVFILLPSFIGAAPVPQSPRAGPAAGPRRRRRWATAAPRRLPLLPAAAAETCGATTVCIKSSHRRCCRCAGTVSIPSGNVHTVVTQPAHVCRYILLSCIFIFPCFTVC